MVQGRRKRQKVPRTNQSVRVVCARVTKQFDLEPKLATDSWLKISPVDAELKELEGASKAEPYVCPDYDDSWVDGGWCQLGWGGDAVRLRLFIDLGAAVSFGPESLFPSLKQKVNDGKLGAAHVISPVDGWKGRKSRCKNWSQLCVKAHSVAGTPAVVAGQNIAFDREGDEKFIVAGRDLARALGYATPKEQQQRAHAERGRGIEVQSLLGAEPVPRSWVISQECIDKIARNCQREAINAKVRTGKEATEHIGEYAFKNVRSCEVVFEPLLLARSYMTSAQPRSKVSYQSRSSRMGISSLRRFG